MQLSLLDRASSAATVSDSGVRTSPHRIDLGEGAWLELVRGFVPGHAGLFELLRQSADWEHHERQMYERVVAVPRLVASCPGTAVLRPFASGSVVRVAPHRTSEEEVRRGQTVLRGLQDVLSARYAKDLVSISLAYYRDGSDSVAFHGDRLGDLRRDTVVAILSLGAPRHFLLRRAPGRPGALPLELLRSGLGAPGGRAAQRPTFAFSLGEGDLLVMGGTCQETWEHGVPKERSAGARIAVMFREASAGAEGGVRNVRGPLRVGAASRPEERLSGAVRAAVLPAD